jgi:hypothetical protein
VWLNDGDLRRLETPLWPIILSKVEFHGREDWVIFFFDTVYVDNFSSLTELSDGSPRRLTRAQFPGSPNLLSSTTVFVPCEQGPDTLGERFMFENILMLVSC